MGQCVADAGGFPSNPGIGRTDVVRRKRLLSVTVRKVKELQWSMRRWFLSVFLFLKPDDVCIVLRYFWMFFPKLVPEHRWFHSFGLAHLYIIFGDKSSPTSLEFASCSQVCFTATTDRRWARNFGGLPEFVDITWHHISQILVTSGAFQTRQSVEVSATRCWVGDLVEEHDHSSRVMHLFMSGSQKFWNLVTDMFGAWAFDYREMELSFEWSEFLSFVGSPYILALALSGPNSDQFFLFRPLWIILGFCIGKSLWLQELPTVPHGSLWCIQLSFLIQQLFLASSLPTESVIHNINHKTQIRWFKWDIYFQFQSISKPSEAAAWCGKSPHHSNSCGSGIHFWMMPSQNLEVAWGRVSTHIWRKRWNKSIGKSMAVLMKHFLYWIIIRNYTVHISTTNSPTIFHHFWPHCYSLPTFQVGPWPGRGASVRCFTSTTWTPLLSST